MVNKAEFIAWIRISGFTKALLKREKQIVNESQREINFRMRIQEYLRPKDISKSLAPILLFQEKESG